MQPVERPALPPDLSRWKTGQPIQYRHNGIRVDGWIDIADPELLKIGMVDFTDAAGMWYIEPISRCRLVRQHDLSYSGE